MELNSSIFIEEGTVWLYLDDKIIADNRREKPKLEAGKNYVVHWFVQGTPGKVYSITISGPREAEFFLKRMIGESGKEFGGFHFGT